MLSEFNAFTLADFPVSLLFKLPESASNLKMVSFYNMSALHGVGLARGREYGVSACITLPRKNTVVSVKENMLNFESARCKITFALIAVWGSVWGTRVFININYLSMF